MTPAKQGRLESGLNAYATKVLEVTPISTSWNLQQIEAEMRRAGANPHRQAVQGSLTTLIDIGLVVEAPIGSFRRRVAPAREPVVEQQHARPVVALATSNGEPAVMPTKNETDTLATIASIASDLRKISTAMSACADKIDDVALQVEERINDAGQAAAQLQQLKAILKGI